MAKFVLTLLTLTLALVAASTNGGVAATDDDDLAQRREYMAQVAQFARPGAAAATDAKTTHRLASFLKREMGPIETIFATIRRMPENSAAEVRAKDDAFDGAMELLDRQFRVLLPNCRADDDIGFAIGKMPESTVAEVRAKQEARAAAKEMTLHIGSLLPGGSVKIIDDL